MRPLGASLIAVLLLGCGGPGELRVHDAWVTPPPGGRGPAGGFAVIENASGDARRLVGASSPACRRVELHRSWIERGVARMERLEAIELPAGETLRLAPGGYHLMLIDPAPLEPGARVSLRLALDGGETRELEAEVRLAGGDPRAAGHEHHGHPDPHDAP